MTTANIQIRRLLLDLHGLVLGANELLYRSKHKDRDEHFLAAIALLKMAHGKVEQVVDTLP